LEKIFENRYIKIRLSKKILGRGGNSKYFGGRNDLPIIFLLLGINTGQNEPI